MSVCALQALYLPVRQALWLSHNFHIATIPCVQPCLDATAGLAHKLRLLCSLDSRILAIKSDLAQIAIQGNDNAIRNLFVLVYHDVPCLDAGKGIAFIALHKGVPNHADKRFFIFPMAGDVLNRLALRLRILRLALALRLDRQGLSCIACAHCLRLLCLPLLAIGAWLFFCDHPLPEGDVRTPKPSAGERR